MDRCDEVELWKTKFQIFSRVETRLDRDKRTGGGGEGVQEPESPHSGVTCLSLYTSLPVSIDE